MVLFVFPCGSPPAFSAFLYRIRDNFGHVHPAVRQRDLYVLRLMDLVRVADADNLLRDCRVELRQRHTAPGAQLHPVHALACGLHQFDAFDVNGHRRLRVFLQPFVRPSGQLFLGVNTLVCFGLADHAVDLCVPVHVFRVNVQVVPADRIEPCEHSAFVDRPPDGLHVPSGPHLRLHIRVFLRDVQQERVNCRVVTPPGAFQAVRHRLQRFKQRVPVELVRIADFVVIEIPQFPVALLRQDILDRLPRRACRRPDRSGDHRRRMFSEQDPLFQRVDDVFQLQLRRPVVECLLNGPDPPYDSFARFPVILQPCRHADPVHALRRHCRGAVPFLQLQAHRLRLDFPHLRQAVSVQQNHL